jgi:hypothetical protein
LLDLVVDQLSEHFTVGGGAMTDFMLGLAIASVAGFSQLYSP